MKDKRYGRFQVDTVLVEENPTLVKSIMSKCIILRAEHLYHKNVIDYLAISDYFDIVEPLYEVPSYTIEYTKGGWKFCKM